MNLSIYLPQIGYIDQGYSNVRYVRTADNFTKQVVGPYNAAFNGFFTVDNLQDIVAGEINTKWFARSDLHWTDFVEVPVEDIKAMNSYNSKKLTEQSIAGYTFKGNYRNGQRIPTDNNWPSAIPIAGDTSATYYFYKGLKESNCIDFLFKLGIVN